jgi:hypothetical protein
MHGVHQAEVAARTQKPLDKVIPPELYSFGGMGRRVLGGDKTGDDRWYEKFVPIADRLYDEHLAAIEKEP